VPLNALEQLDFFGLGLYPYPQIQSKMLSNEGPKRRIHATSNEDGGKGSSATPSNVDAATTTTTPETAEAPEEESTQKKTTKQPTARRRQPLTQQQRMLLQMKAQQQMEQDQEQFVQAYTGNAFSEHLWKLLRTVALLLLVAGILLYYYQPRFIMKWFVHKPMLPPRSLISVYPSHVNIRRDLPRWFHEYSIATPDNLLTRQAIRHVLQDLRSMATNPGSKYRQTINLWPWELQQFQQQLPNRQTMDGYCGPGTYDIYYASGTGEQQQGLQSDILLWCLLAAGHDHGMVHYDVQRVHGSVARGIHGVAVRYDNDENDNHDGSRTPSSRPRVMARSILLLPFHTTEDLIPNEPLNRPSTQVAIRTMDWIRQNAPLLPDYQEFTIALEEFLYYAISQENKKAQKTDMAKNHHSLNMTTTKKWYWLYAACTPAQRQARQGQPRVATMCPPNQQEEAVEDDESSCCDIYDPHLYEFYGRTRPQPKSKHGKSTNTQKKEETKES
jgi:hypothetical protein